MVEETLTNPGSTKRLTTQEKGEKGRDSHKTRKKDVQVSVRGENGFARDAVYRDSTLFYPRRRKES